MHRNRSLDGGSRYKVCRTFSSSLKATAFKGSSQRSDMLRPTGPMSALMQFSLKSRLTANGPLQPLSTLSRTAQKRTRLTAVTSSADGAVTTALHHFTMRPVRWCALLCLPPYCGRAPALHARRSGTRFMIASSSAAPSSLRPHANVQMV